MAGQDSPQQSLPIDMPTFSNQDLFAERYLEGKDRLLALREWQEPDGLSEAFEALRELCQKIGEKLEKGKQGRSLFKHEPCPEFVEEGSCTTHHIHETVNWSEDAFEVFLRELGGTVANLSDFIDAYRNYADDYTRVIDDLSATDNLIERIVYAVYGVREEEIGVVEDSEVGR